jgi:hypothetical protein
MILTLRHGGARVPFRLILRLRRECHPSDKIFDSGFAAHFPSQTEIFKELDIGEG